MKRQRQQVADDIKGAVEKLQATEENLVEDGSRVHSLPTVETRNHRDLKTVTPSTVSSFGVYSFTRRNENIKSCNSFEYATYMFFTTMNCHYIDPLLLQVQQLLQGDFSDDVSSYKIIDCRYPYEYEGGHIQGAVNIYTEEGIGQLVNEAATSPVVLIFHCEFSSERGPKM